MLRDSIPGSQDRGSLGRAEVWPQKVGDRFRVLAPGVPDEIRAPTLGEPLASGPIDVRAADATVPDRLMEALQRVGQSLIEGRVLLHLQPELGSGDPGAPLAIEEASSPRHLDLIHGDIVAGLFRGGMSAWT